MCHCQYHLAFTDRHCDGYSHSNINRNGDSYCNYNSYSYSYSYSNPDSDAEADACAETDAKATTATTATAATTGSARRPRNSGDRDQLHRKLAQCTRRDWLPVGCSYRPCFWPLCARLPKFGRWQHNESERYRAVG